MKPKQSQKMLATVQLRLQLQKKAKWKGLAAMYAGGNLSLLVETSMDEWEPRYIIGPNTSLGRRIRKPR